MTAPKEKDVRQTFDPAKRWRYTWPGQAPKVVSGDELTALCRGADASLLAIEEVSGTTVDTPGGDTIEDVDDLSTY